MQPTSEAAGRQSGPPRSALVYIYMRLYGSGGFAARFTRGCATPGALGRLRVMYLGIYKLVLDYIFAI